MKEPGECVENYKSQPVGFLFFMFSSMEQMQRILIEEYGNSMVMMEEVQEDE